MMRRTAAMLLALAVVAVTSITLFAQAKPAAQPPAKPAATPPAPATPAKLSPPVRGEATIEVTPPKTDPVKNNMVVTTIKVRNVSQGSIAGLRVSEFWYDKAGNPVTGADGRLRTPLQPGQTHTFVLETPFKKEMYRNQYQFSHANGKIKTKPVSKIEG